MQKKVTLIAILIALILAFFLLLFSLCSSDVERPRYTGRRVRMYSGGVLVGEWISEGRVTSAAASDMFMFTDRARGKRISVSGEVIVDANVETHLFD